MKNPSKEEIAVSADLAEERSISTGEVLRERGLCPLVIVRTYGAGVHVGLLVRVQGQEVELFDARRLWRWQGANTLHEVARDGVSEGFTRLSEPVERILLTSAVEVLPVSSVATKSLTQSRWPK